MTRDTPLSDLGLSPVALRALYDAGCKTVGDSMSVDGLSDMRGIGPASVKSLQAAWAEAVRSERPRCEVCRHWTKGTCRRYPPIALRVQTQPRPDRPLAGAWPETEPTDFCGEYGAA